MKYIKKSEVKLNGVRPQNALHYEDFAVFTSVEEYEKFNQYPTQQQLEEKQKEIYDRDIKTAFMGDGLTHSYYEQQFEKNCKREAEKYFDDIRQKARGEIAKGATQTDKAYIVLKDIDYRHGDIVTIGVAAFDSVDVVKEFLRVHGKDYYVVDQDNNRIYGKSLEEKQYEQATQNEGLNA